MSTDAALIADTAKKETRPKAAERAASRRATSPYLWITLAMTTTVFVGFWFTYFGPIARATYPAVPAIVHVHGWSYFVWYLLLPLQAGLVRSGQVRIHRALGLASVALGAVIIGVGLIVSTLRVNQSLGPEAEAFWIFMGMPIFSIWLLFTVFYVAAIRARRRPAEHKRLILLASAAAMSAATFRIFVQILGTEPWVVIAGTLSPVLFICVAGALEYRQNGTMHRIYKRGAFAILAVVGGAFLLPVLPGGDLVRHGVAWVGHLLGPLY